MRKCLILAMLVIAFVQDTIKAQNLFSAPDTVCVDQPVYLFDSVENAKSYYWGFCSGYMLNTPQVQSGSFEFTSSPHAIEIIKDNNVYYGFVAIRGEEGTPDSLIRLQFGTRLSNSPDTFNLGTLNGTMPIKSTKFQILQHNGSWHAFICGGTEASNSSVARLDFGHSLTNTPNSANFGNLSGLFDRPRGIIITKVQDTILGYVANLGDNKLLRLHFGTNISLTPLVEDLGNNFSLDAPSDMTSIQENDEWYVIAVNQGNSSLVRLDFGASMKNDPTGTNIGTFNNRLFSPSGISFIRDCDYMHLFVTNELSNDFLKLDFPSIHGPFTDRLIAGASGVFNAPAGITKFIRDRDSIYSFVSNMTGNNLSTILFHQCTQHGHADTLTAQTRRPPAYAYKSPGIFNVYHIVNEGEPDMRVQCKQIVVLPKPGITLSNDTSICQGDTVSLFARSITAQSYTWYPNYNISDTTAPILMDVQVWPAHSTDYHIVFPYLNGCIVDTLIRVHVSKNKADAGVDRIIHDGGSTTLGGPNTTEGDINPSYRYRWFPDQFLSRDDEPFTVANPPYDFTYYLEVRNSFGCYSIDTVNVKVECNNINMPNAFIPSASDGQVNKFGIKNRQLVKVNYFKIFDRWGKEVFLTTDATREWDGTINGTPAPMGVYVWEIDAFCTDNKRYHRSGNVTLIR